MAEINKKTLNEMLGDVTEETLNAVDPYLKKRSESVSTMLSRYRDSRGITAVKLPAKKEEKRG